MGYLVITGVDKKTSTYHTVLVDPTAFTPHTDYGFVPEETIVRFLSANQNVSALNFSLDRNGKIQQNCGDFSRFSKRGSAVVLAEIKTRGGRVLGYRLMSCANSAVVNTKLEDILAREKAYSASGEHFLQNGIIRNNTVNCYPQKPFPVIQTDAKRGVHPDAAKKFEAAGTQRKPKPVKPQKPAAKPEDFTKEQMQELTRCKNAGVNPTFITNPKLSPAQMRVLWVAKSKGCMAECFADSKYSTDAMKFYADRLYDEQTAADCRELLEHPELGVEELSELYTCVCQGVPCSEYIGMSATDIDVKREMAVAQYWGSIDSFDSDYLEKAANVARRMKGSV